MGVRLYLASQIMTSAVCAGVPHEEESLETKAS